MTVQYYPYHDRFGSHSSRSGTWYMPKASLKSLCSDRLEGVTFLFLLKC